MGLFAELGRAADDIVATVGDVGNHACAVVKELESDVVANSNRVGLLASAKAVVATETTVDDRIIGEHDAIPTARCSHN